MSLDGCWTGQPEGATKWGQFNRKQKGRGGKKAGWRALYRDNDGKQRSKSFDRIADAP